MIKVRIVNKNKEIKEFVAQDTCQEYCNGRALFWNLESGDVLVIPLIEVSEITEREEV